MNLYACTYFDIGYFERGCLAVDSLLLFEPRVNVRVYSLCERSFRLLTEKYSSDLNVSVLQIEEAAIGMSLDGSDSSSKEFVSLDKRNAFFSISPAVIKHAMSDLTDDDWLLYFDADLRFYSSPFNLVCRESEDISLTSHQFTWWNKRLKKYGSFNFGLNFFKQGPIARNFLELWDASLKGVSHNLEVKGKKILSDQIFFDNLLTRDQFPYSLLDGKGANLGPWNLHKYSFRCEKGKVLLNGSIPLVCIHFTGLQRISDDLWTISKNGSFFRANSCLRSIYRSYITDIGRPEPINRPKGLRRFLILLANFLLGQLIRVEYYK